MKRKKPIISEEAMTKRSKNSVMFHIENIGLLSQNENYDKIELNTVKTKENLLTVLKKYNFSVLIFFRHEAETSQIEEKLKSVNSQISRIDTILENSEKIKSEFMKNKKLLNKFKFEMQRKYREFEVNANSKIQELERKINVLFERTDMYKQKTEESNKLALQIQNAETKLRKKAEKLEKIEELIKQEYNKEIIGPGEISNKTIDQQIKTTKEQNDQLQKAFFLYFYHILEY